MEQFPHLKFFHVVEGKARGFGGGEEPERTKKNKDNRPAHAEFLTNKIGINRKKWIEDYGQRENLAPLPPEIQPVLLELNPEKLKIVDFDLLDFNIEIVSEGDDGLIVAASLDNLYALEEKIQGFIKEKHGTAAIAEFWNIVEGDRSSWKPQHILSNSLLEAWPEIQDEKTYKVEVGIAFNKPIPKEPDISKKGGLKRHQKYEQSLEERDQLLLERQDHFEEFINHYGSITSSFIEFEDSLSCEVEISGTGLKDLVINYPFVFEVNEKEEIEIYTENPGTASEIEFEVQPPEPNSPIVGVIDSGIQENHKLLENAINGSISHIPTDSSTADYVKPNGHGTRVAGAVLYPEGISHLISPYRLPVFIRNLRVLDGSSALLHKYPADLIETIVQKNPDCELFNLSISSKAGFRKKHMSSWASTIDELTYYEEVLFILVSGNLYRDTIRQYLLNGLSYPDYLHEAYCRIANPGQSAFGITVGSVNQSDFEDNDWVSLGKRDEVSAFSRIGLGIWDMVKPDVVEYGGGLVVSKNSLKLVNVKSELSPELTRSTLHKGPAFSKDEVGTSFAAPKVTHILAQLKKIYPGKNNNLLRALLIQGTRLPGRHFLQPSVDSLRYFGYGLPSIDRVTRNTDHRVTFYNTAEIKAEQAHVYKLDIPEELRRPEDEYDILIEITLAYTSKVRRTRQRLKSYLATWLDWETSRLGEPHSLYKNFVLKEIEGRGTEYDKKRSIKYYGISWKIGGQSNYGETRELSRTNSTLQKDWAILKSYQLPEELSVAVKGHKGWDKNQEEVPYAISVTFEILGANIPIYELIKVENEAIIET